MCLYAVNILVLCIATCENSDLVRTHCHTNAPMCTFCHVRHVVSRKKYTTAPPRELLYQLNRYKMVVLAQKRHGPPQKSCHTGSSKTGYGHVLGLRNYKEASGGFFPGRSSGSVSGLAATLAPVTLKIRPQHCPSRHPRFCWPQPRPRHYNPQCTPPTAPTSRPRSRHSRPAGTVSLAVSWSRS